MKKESLKIQGLFCLVALIAALQFTLVSCSGNDDLLPPGKAVSSMSFRDEDPDEGLISGSLKWVNPEPETNIDKYHIYVSSVSTAKEVFVGEALKGFVNYEIPAGTPYKRYIVMVAANAAGESSSLASLEITDDVKKPPVVPPLQGAYILNSGTMEGNNSTLDFLNMATGQTGISSGVFQSLNGRKLGSLANDMIVYGEKIYILVSGSETIEVTDLDGKSLKQLKTEGQPRAAVSHGPNVYVSLFNGNVIRLDTATFSISATVKVGRNPEQLVVANSKIYVANSGGMDYPNYDRTVSVIDIASFKEIKKIDVAPNPTNMAVSGSGDVYVSSNDYSTPAVLQRIDSKEDTVIVVEGVHASEMSATDSRLYYFFTPYDENFTPLPTVYGIYDMVNRKVLDESFVTNDDKLKNPYKVFVDKATENVYVAASDYVSNGEIRFYFQGQFMEKWETGLMPVKMIFVERK